MRRADPMTESLRSSKLRLVPGDELAKETRSDGSRCRRKTRRCHVTTNCEHHSYLRPTIKTDTNVF